MFAGIDVIGYDVAESFVVGVLVAVAHGDNAGSGVCGNLGCICTPFTLHQNCTAVRIRIGVRKKLQSLNANEYKNDKKKNG